MTSSLISDNVYCIDSPTNALLSLARPVQASPHWLNDSRIDSILALLILTLYTGAPIGHRLRSRCFANVSETARSLQLGQLRGIITPSVIWSGPRRKLSSGSIIHFPESFGSWRAAPSRVGGITNYFGEPTAKTYGRILNSGQTIPYIIGYAKPTGAGSANIPNCYLNQNINIWNWFASNIRVKRTSGSISWIKSKTWISIS